jgi:hypothetical protein
LSFRHLSPCTGKRILWVDGCWECCKVNEQESEACSRDTSSSPPIHRATC